MQKKASAAPKADGVGVDQLVANAVEVQGVKIVAADVPGGTPQSLRDLIDQLRRKAAPVAVLLGTKQDEGKVMLIAGLSRDLVDRGLDCVQWIRAAAALVGGKGGGRADMAQAGGKLAEKLGEALELGRKEIGEAAGWVERNSLRSKSSLPCSAWQRIGWPRCGPPYSISVNIKLGSRG